MQWTLKKQAMGHLQGRAGPKGSPSHPLQTAFPHSCGWRQPEVRPRVPICRHSGLGGDSTFYLWAEFKSLGPPPPRASGEPGAHSWRVSSDRTEGGTWSPSLPTLTSLHTPASPKASRKHLGQSTWVQALGLVEPKANSEQSGVAGGRGRALGSGT